MKTYTIKAPGHYSNSPKALLVNPVGCFFDVTLSPQEFEVGQDSYEQHKLFGFSRGHHHWNSFRVGFIFTGTKFILTSYVYDNGKKPYPKYNVVGWINLTGTEPYLRIEAFMFLKDQEVNICGLLETEKNEITFGYHQAYSKKNLFPIGYKLGFAWGDNEPTTKDKTIIINKIQYL